MIATFYSYKGGVGRSMALANVAEWFRLNGLRVVMVDWDLEAPGLESFFYKKKQDRESMRGRLGLIDLIATYKELYSGLPQIEKPETTHGTASSIQAQTATIVELLNTYLPPLAHMLAPIESYSKPEKPGGRLWLLTAGCRSAQRFDTYAETVQRFDWDEFYQDFAGEAYFEWMRQQLLDSELADIVLIDSRTGVAEMTGVCTRQLADVVVIFCAPNDQNLEGVAMMARSFTRPELVKARGGRQIKLLMVPARVDVAEGRPVDLFEERFDAALSSYTPETFQRLREPKKRLRIPYISSYAYSERLAIGDPEGVKSMQEAYVCLATHLVALAPADSIVRHSQRETLKAMFELPTVMVAHLDADQRLSIDLYDRLENAGVIVIRNPDPPESVLEIAVKERTSSKDPASLVVTVSQAMAYAHRLRTLWRRARTQGICLFIACANSPEEIELSGLPRAPIFHIERDIETLVTLLQSPCRISPIPLMTPAAPIRFIGRSEELKLITSMLLDSSDSAKAITLYGIGGVGKTAIACMVCGDDRIIDGFQDGIIWLKFGSGADLFRELTAVVAAFGHDTRSIANIEQAERRVAELLETKRCLIVADDVKVSSRLKFLSLGGPKCRWMITTRVPDLILDGDLETITIGGLKVSDARNILSHGVPGVDNESDMVDDLVGKMGGLPLALLLANQFFREQVPSSESAQDAIAELLQRLDKEGLTAIDPSPSAGPSDSVFASLMVSVELMTPDDRARLPLLADIAPNVDLDIGEVAQVSKLDQQGAKRLLASLHSASFVEIDPASAKPRIHPIVHVFLKSLQIRQRRVEATRSATRIGLRGDEIQHSVKNGTLIKGSAPFEGAIWISYRRQDAPTAARLYDRLTQEVGYDRVLMDIDSIEPGADFLQIIKEIASRASLMLVLIGPNWVSDADMSGRRRLDDPSDFVRTEIAIALDRDLRVIPVLIGNANMPKPESLPDDLKPLLRRNAWQIRASSFNTDVDMLINDIRRIGESAPRMDRSDKASRVRSPLVYVLALLAVLVVSGVSIWIYGQLRTPVGQEKTPIDQRSFAEAEKMFIKAEDYYFGRGVEQNYAEAFRLYKQAAELGYAPAQNSLGRAYENGLGVAVDQDKAVYWYKAAAKQNHPDAQAALLRLTKNTKK